jgi:SHAQKYF class myb-like DNA-binding protein
VAGSSSNAPIGDDDDDDLMDDGDEEDPNMTQSTGRINNNQTIIVGNQYQGRWTDEEHEKFLEGLRLFGKDWRRIEEFIGSRSCAQIRSHAQKYFNRLQRDLARGIKRADAAQAQMLLGKKKRKQLAQASEE